MTSYSSSGAPPLRHVHEPERRTPVRWEGDVVVLGGGAAGLAAAVAAAREGASVLLVERFGYLGGVMTAVSLGTICGIYGIGADDKPYPLVAGIAQEVVDRLHQCDGAAAPRRWLGAVTVPYDVFSLKVVLDEMAKQAGVRLAFHVQLVDCIAEGEKVQAAILQDKSGRWAARARVFVDATGDADLVAMSGGAYEYEPEEMQLPSTTFRLCAVDDTAARAVTRENLRHRMEEAIRQGWDLPRSCGGVYFHKPGMAHLNITRVSAGGRSPNPLDTFELTRPLSAQPSLVVLRGSLAPMGALLKLGTGSSHKLHFTGPARVFHSQEDAIAAIGDGRLASGDVAVLRYLGPKGGPGLAYASWFVAALEGSPLGEKVAVVTDGQLSGLNRGIACGQVAPEAAEGGPIALVEDGDRIEIDVATRTVGLLVDEARLARRQADLKPWIPARERGWLSIYQRLARPIYEGGTLTPKEEES